MTPPFPILIGICLVSVLNLPALADATTPATYSATATIRLQPDIDLPTGQAIDAKPQIVATVKAIRSSDTLWPVIKELKLDDAWGKEVENMKAAMPKAAAIVTLNGRLKFDSVAETREIRITARGVTPEEATAIAHSVAYHYVALRNSQEKERFIRKTTALWELMIEQFQLVGESATKLDLLYVKEAPAGQEPNTPALIKEIADCQEAANNLLRDGLEITHPRVHAYMSEVFRKQTQIKDLIAGWFKRKDVTYSKALVEARNSYDEQERVLEALQNRLKEILDRGPGNPVEIVSQAVPPPESSEPKPGN
jgi:uncharacterized protein involved in exopolysaccharide biosynthesis